MTGHPTFQELKAFESKALKPNRLLEVSRHLKECSACRGTLRLPVPVVRDYPAIGKGGIAEVYRRNTTLKPQLDRKLTVHLTYEKKEGYLDNQLSWKERELVEEHLRACKSCAAEILHLKQFSEMVTTAQQVLPEQRSSGNGIKSFFSSAYAHSLTIASFAAVLVILIILTLLWRSPAERPKVVTTGRVQESPLKVGIEKPTPPPQGETQKPIEGDKSSAAPPQNSTTNAFAEKRSTRVQPPAERRAAEVVSAPEQNPDPPVETSPPNVRSGRAFGIPPSGSSSGISAKVGGTTPPTVVKKVEPEYTNEAREAGYQGTVVVSVIIRANGTVDIVEVVRGLQYGLNEKAMEALKQWKFRPGMQNGEPIDVPLNIEVIFKLR